MHSWVVDLILRHVVGVQPNLEGRSEVDPLPLGVDRIDCEGIPGPEGPISVSIAGGKAAVERCG
jgi:hypothetical protein